MTHPAGSARAARYTWPLFRAALASGKTLTLPVNGDCMWPALRPKDKVIVRSLEQHEVRVGDVLVCVHGERAVAHRVARLDLNSAGEKVVQCKGDTARHLDAEVRLKDVCGVVIGVERGNRRIPLARQSRLRIVLGELRRVRSLLGAWRRRPRDLVRLLRLRYAAADDRLAESDRSSVVG